MVSKTILSEFFSSIDVFFPLKVTNKTYQKLLQTWMLCCKYVKS